MNSLTNLLRRYAIATVGLFLIALGVAVSLKSNLGTSPISCPPGIMTLKWTSVSIGQFTWYVNFSLILVQLALLRSRFRWSDLMQIPAVILFGLLCDVCVWLCQSLPTDGYWLQMLWCLVAILITAVGLRVEIYGNAWMLSGDKTVNVISDISGVSFSTVKVWSDIFFVAISMAFAWFVFGSLFGDGESNIIREGTLLLAVLTGLCMKITDPYVERLLKRLVPIRS